MPDRCSRRRAILGPLPAKARHLLAAAFRGLPFAFAGWPAWFGQTPCRAANCRHARTPPQVRHPQLRAPPPWVHCPQRSTSRPQAKPPTRPPRAKTQKDSLVSCRRKMFKVLGAHVHKPHQHTLAKVAPRVSTSAKVWSASAYLNDCSNRSNSNRKRYGRCTNAR